MIVRGYLLSSNIVADQATRLCGEKSVEVLKCWSVEVAVSAEGVLSLIVRGYLLNSTNTTPKTRHLS